MCMDFCTYGAIPCTTETAPETEISRTTETEMETENENGNENRTVNLRQYTQLRSEHAYMFVCKRYLLRLYVRIIIGHMAFPLPPNTLLRLDDDLSVRLAIVFSTSAATATCVFLIALGRPA